MAGLKLQVSCCHACMKIGAAVKGVGWFEIQPNENGSPLTHEGALPLIAEFKRTVLFGTGVLG